MRKLFRWGSWLSGVCDNSIVHDLSVLHSFPTRVPQFIGKKSLPVHLVGIESGSHIPRLSDKD
ncbi:uncharacterized protein J3R85_002552 [Psidium guajava]|nr:uncharacterized protein J3R85_002552 [Psidium guajava]